MLSNDIESEPMNLNQENVDMFVERVLTVVENEANRKALKSEELRVSMEPLLEEFAGREERDLEFYKNLKGRFPDKVDWFALEIVILRICLRKQIGHEKMKEIKLEEMK